MKYTNPIYRNREEAADYPFWKTDSFERRPRKWQIYTNDEYYSSCLQRWDRARRQET